MAHVSALTTATPVLPLSADLENGFGDDAQTVAETVRARRRCWSRRVLDRRSGRDARTGACTSWRTPSIVSGRPSRRRRRSRSRFTLTARAENYLTWAARSRRHHRAAPGFSGRGRGRAYAPGLVAADDIATVVRSVDRPINVLMGLQGGSLQPERPVRARRQAGERRQRALSEPRSGRFSEAPAKCEDTAPSHFADEGRVSYRDISAMFRPTHDQRLGRISSAMTPYACRQVTTSTSR